MAEWKDGVLRASLVSTDVTLDLRRRLPLRTFLTLRRIVSRDLPESSESELDDELSLELDESSQAAAGPGVDSASTMC